MRGIARWNRYVTDSTHRECGQNQKMARSWAM